MRVTNSQSEVSDALFNLATSPPVIPSRSDAKKARGQCQWMIALIRGVVKGAGFELVSPSNVAAFSEHGSVFERTHNHKINDIDVYVILNAQ
jgi:CRISPR/Cas system CSM-associated protein Csm4 (group 5 of RAMP superfamily)